MLENREMLHEKFKGILGSNYVYFQPPSNIQINYPAIIYNTKGIVNRYADNKKHVQFTSYNVVVVDYKPNSTIADKISKLPMCELNTSPYIVDNLNHFSFTLFY